MLSHGWIFLIVCLTFLICICRILYWSLSFKVSKSNSLCFRFKTHFVFLRELSECSFLLQFVIANYILFWFACLQSWPVRTPRPVASKLAADTPLLTGQVDWMFILSNLISFGCVVSDDFIFVSACSRCPFPLCSWWHLCHSWSIWLWKNSY